MGGSNVLNRTFVMYGNGVKVEEEIPLMVLMILTMPFLQKSIVDLLSL